MSKPTPAERVSKILEPLDPDMQLSILATMLVLAAAEANYGEADMHAWIRSAIETAEGGAS